MAEWRVVPSESKYWHPVNKGFNSHNAKYMCSECGAQFPLPRCVDCGAENSQLGKSSIGLPGVFCENCGMGEFTWTCPSCKKTHKTMVVFYYDAYAIQVRKKGFWD